MPNNVIILAGPGGLAFNKKNVLDLEKAFKKLGANVVRIGDGESAISTLDINERLLKQISGSTDRTLLFIMAHGTVKNGNHLINLTGDSSLVKTTALFDKLNSLEKPIDIFSGACYGAAAHEYAQSKLPNGSTYVSLSPASESVAFSDVNDLIEIMATSEITNKSITAEQLALLYLTKALQNRIPPSISTINSSADLYEKFTSHLGVKFYEHERLFVYQALGGLVKKSELDLMMAKIENSKNDWLFNAKVFGLALAISHAASGDMLEVTSSLQIKEQPEPFGESSLEKVKIEETMPMLEKAKDEFKASFVSSGKTSFQDTDIDFTKFYDIRNFRMVPPLKEKKENKQGSTLKYYGGIGLDFMGGTSSLPALARSSSRYIPSKGAAIPGALVMGSIGYAGLFAGKRADDAHVPKEIEKETMPVKKLD